MTHLKTGDVNDFLIKFIKQVQNVKKLITIEKLEINYYKNSMEIRISQLNILNPF